MKIVVHLKYYALDLQYLLSSQIIENCRINFKLDT